MQTASNGASQLSLDETIAVDSSNIQEPSTITTLSSTKETFPKESCEGD